MNALVRLSACLCPILLATTASADPLLDEARATVDKTLLDIHNNRLGAAWESFSESSREAYRVALLASLEARQAAGMPIMPPATKPEPRRPDTKNGVKRYLEDRGFESNLGAIKKMPGERFWEVFIHEQKRQDDLAADRDPAGAKRERVPPYEVEAATERNGIIFIILKIPCLCNHLLYRPLEVRHTPVDPQMGADSANVRIVWTGKRKDGRIILDLPMDMIAKEAVIAASAKQMMEARKAWPKKKK